MLKAHEITTVYTLKSVSKMFVERYIVIAETSSKANSLVPLRDTEEIVHTEELNHIVIIEDENGRTKSY